MASGPAPLASSKETTNYARLCRLLVDMGSQALKETFDRIHPPNTLHKILSGAHPTLQSLRTKGILNPTQWGKLYPTAPSSVSSASFDITLLMVLLRNICSFSPPASTGSWDKLPPSHDNSIEANIARIKYYRNGVYGHASQASVNDVTFNMLWQDISNALLALGSGTIYASAISRLKTECMDPDYEEHYRELLKQWKKDDDNTKETLEELKEMLTTWNSEEGDTKDRLGEMEGRLANTKLKRKCCPIMADIFVKVYILKRLETDEGSSKDMPKQAHKMLRHLKDKLNEMEDNLVITEDQALLLLSSKLTFRGVVLLKMALDHIPITVSVIPRGTTIPLRFSFARQILEKNGVKLAEAEVQIYAHIMERCSSVFGASFKFELDDSLWELTGEGSYHYNRFIVPPVESCLHSDNALASVTFVAGRGPVVPNHCWVSFSGFSEAYNEAFVNNIEKYRAMVGGDDIQLEEKGNSSGSTAVLSLGKGADKGGTKTAHEKIEEQLEAYTQGNTCTKQVDAATCQGETSIIRVTLTGLLILVLWLYRKFKPLLDDGMPPEELMTVMSSTIVAYDNMCHVDGLKVARVDLPFEDPLKKVWQCVVKVIDKLHIRNHKDEKCKTLYNPIDKVPDGYNTMAAEQTFVWDAYGPVADFIDFIRQLYKSREGWLAPFPWCEEFQFHLDNIFTRLKMVSRKKEQGVKTDSIVNMLEIFKPNKECPQPKRVLIEGEPGVGKTTYCNKVAYDWAKNREAEDSFPDVKVLLLLKCRDINSDLWEAIDDQLLPEDIKKEEREKFFTFIRDHQSKVLLVLDGLDELPTHKLPVYEEIIRGRMLSKCYLIVTARHKAGIKVHECCDTLLEVKGFTKYDAKAFISRYFKTEERLAKKLFERLDSDASLGEVTANPLNAALLCLLCEDCQGDLPKGRTLLYVAIVQCVLRRYRRKKELPETDEDLTQLYHTELKHLGCIALNGLLNDEMCFNDSAFQSGTGNLIPELGFLSAQPGRSKRRPSCYYGFLHKSFQEFFAAFYLSCQLVDEEISPDSLVADTRYFGEFQQVLKFTCGILARWCEAKAMALMVNISSQINQSNEDESNNFLWTALNCIKESENEQGTFGKELACSLGSLLKIQRIYCRQQMGDSGAAILAHAMATNSTVKKLHLLGSEIGDLGVAALAKAVEINSTLTELDLSGNRIGNSGAAAVAKAVKINSTLTELHLSGNGIGDSGAAALAKAVEINSTLDTLGLSGNGIGDSGAAALAKAVEINSMLTVLDLSENRIGELGVAALAKALEISSTLTELDLSGNGVGDTGAAALAKAVEINSTLTRLDLSDSDIGESGAAALAKAVEINSTLTELDLFDNRIGDLGVAALAKAVEISSTLTELDLSDNQIGDSGAAALAKAVEINSTLTQLYLSDNGIGDTGAAALAKAVEINSTLSKLLLSCNGVTDVGAAALAKAVEINSTLTELYLGCNRIGDTGAVALAKAVEINSTLKRLELSGNGIGDLGAAALAKAVEINSTLTVLYLSGNKIGDSGAAVLAKAVEINSTLTTLGLSDNRIGDSGAAALAEAVEINSTLTGLNLTDNRIGGLGVAALAKAVEISSTLTDLDLFCQEISDSEMLRSEVGEVKEMLTTWMREEGDIKDQLGEMYATLKMLETDEGSSKDTLKETHAPFASSKETTNYARLCRLLVDVGTQALRDTFDAIHPPATLHKSLSAAHPTLQSLRKKRIFNPTQWGKLYPTHPSSVSSASFDITLLMVLLRNICCLTPPASTGSWDKLPPPGDNSLEANIARIIYYRNQVYAQASQASVDDATFNLLWQDISNALLALGSGTTYASAISRLKTECMGPDVEEHYRELLKRREKVDDDAKKLLEELKEMLATWKREKGDKKDQLGEMDGRLANI
ncbi:uncharacterized protein [Montipora capricornis]|uniref:uncharacterized protein n=1 Tax=Montipora capricornis TaxID=246305 RepID=UPI0035F17074